MKKRILSAILASVMLLALTACGGNSAPSDSTDSGNGSDSTTYRIAYFNRDDTDEYLNGFTSGVEALCAADSSISFTRYDAQADANNQLMQVEDALSKGVDLIILSVQDKETMVSKVKECNEKGIPVICIDISMARSDDYYFDFVGSNNYDLAYEEGTFMMEHLPENGKILYMRFRVGSETSRLRHEGVMAAIEDSGRTDYELLTTMEYDGTIEDAMSKMEDNLQVYGNDWDAYICPSDRGLYGGLSAIEGANYDPATKIICSIDGEPMAAQMILDGRASCSVKQDQQGIIDKTFELVKAYQAGETLEKNGDYYVPGFMVNADNAADYIA